jgi:CubicO group peptidase (beta-lactamase class C family)
LTKDYGFADVSQQKLVTSTFHLASLTKTFASLIVLQLVNEGLIDLNAPVSDYGITLVESDTVRVIHLLTHTSEGVPGAKYKYNGDRYALLSTVVESASGKPFHQLVSENITQPLGLQNTAPSNMKFAAAVGLDTILLKQNTARI